MGFLSELFGARQRKTGEARTIAEVETALKRLAAERSAEREAVAAAMAERERLLLVDGSDAKIAELDAAADRRRLALERLERAEPLLLAELEQLRSDAKQAAWRDLRERYDGAALDYARALRAAAERMMTMLRINDEARAAGFERETIVTFTPPMRIVTIEAVDLYEAAIERAREMARPRPAPAAQLVQMAPPAKEADAPKPPPAPAPAKRPNAPHSEPRAPAKPFKPPTPDENGEVEIIVVRPGTDIEIEGARLRTGQRARIPADQALAIVRGGSADYAEAMR